MTCASASRTPRPLRFSPATFAWFLGENGSRARASYSGASCAGCLPEEFLETGERTPACAQWTPKVLAEVVDRGIGLRHAALIPSTVAVPRVEAGALSVRTLWGNH